MADDTDYVVAPGVSLFINDDSERNSGEQVWAEDFESLAEFRGLIAAGKIIAKPPEPPEPEPEKRWDYYSIDEKLDEKSPNPVSNRAVTKVINEIIAGGVVPIPLDDIDALF